MILVNDHAPHETGRIRLAELLPWMSAKLARDTARKVDNSAEDRRETRR